MPFSRYIFNYKNEQETLYTRPSKVGKVGISRDEVCNAIRDDTDAFGPPPPTKYIYI